MIDDYAAEAPVPDPPTALAEAIEGLEHGVGLDVLALRRRALSRAGKTRTALLRAEAAAAAGTIAPRAGAEVWAWVTWMAVIRGAEIRTTVPFYVGMLVDYLAWCQRQRVDYCAASLMDLEAWQRWLFLDRRHAAQHRARQGYAVRNFYAWRHLHGLGPNCGANLRMPRESRRVPRKYSDEQVRAMLVAAGKHRYTIMAQRNRLLILFLLTTGCRREEACRLNLDDLELGQRTGAVRVHGKGAKERIVPIEGPVVEGLRRWLLTRAEMEGLTSEAVFVTTHHHGIRGRAKLGTIERVVRLAAEGAGLRDWGVHRFRVTFATALYDQGADIEEIRILLGHGSIETTRRYLAVSERLRRTRLKSGYQSRLLGEPVGVPAWIGRVLGDSHAVE